MLTETQLLSNENINFEIAERDPLGFLNFNQAERHLQDLIPRAKIEYLIKNFMPGYQKGFFTFNLGYQKEEIRVVVLAMKFSRIMWEEYNPKIENPEPLCKSDNGEFSNGGTAHDPINPIACESCKHASWGNDGNPPACSDVYTLLLYDIEDSIPFILGVKRTSIYPLRKLKTGLKIVSKKFAHKNCAPNACVSVLLRTKAVDNYYVVDFPQRDLKGNPLWQQLSEHESLYLTKQAMDLSSNFHSVDVQEVVDISKEDCT